MLSLVRFLLVTTFFFSSFAAEPLEEDAAGQALTLPYLPPEILIKVANNFTHPRDMAHFRATCKLFKNIADDPEKELKSHLTLRGIRNIKTLTSMSPNEIGHILLVSDPDTFPENFVTPVLLEKAAQCLRMTPVRLAQYFGRHRSAFTGAVKDSVERSAYPVADGFQEQVAALQADTLFEESAKLLVPTKLLTALFELVDSNSFESGWIGNMLNTFRFTPDVAEAPRYPFPLTLHNILQQRFFVLFSDAQENIHINLETFPELQHLHLLQLASAHSSNHHPYQIQYSTLASIFESQENTHDLYWLSKIVLEIPLREEAGEQEKAIHYRTRANAAAKLLKTDRQEVKDVFQEIMATDLPINVKAETFQNLLFEIDDDDISLEEFGFGGFIDQVIASEETLPQHLILCARIEYSAHDTSARFNHLLARIKALPVDTLKELDPYSQYDFISLLYATDPQNERIITLLDILLDIEDGSSLGDRYIEIARLFALKRDFGKAKEAILKCPDSPYNLEEKAKVFLLLEDYDAVARIISEIADPEHPSFGDLPQICHQYYNCTHNKDVIIPHIEVLRSTTAENAGALALLFHHLGYEEYAREAYEKTKGFLVHLLVKPGFLEGIRRSIEKTLPKLIKNPYVLENLQIHVDADTDQATLEETVLKELILPFTTIVEKIDTLEFEEFLELFDKINAFANLPENDTEY